MSERLQYRTPMHILQRKKPTVAKDMEELKNISEAILRIYATILSTQPAYQTYNQSSIMFTELFGLVLQQITQYPYSRYDIKTYKGEVQKKDSVKVKKEITRNLREQGVPYKKYAGRYVFAVTQYMFGNVYRVMQVS